MRRARISAQIEGVRKECGAIRDWIVALREKLMQQFDNLRLKGVAEGSQPFILWKNRQYATHRRSYDPSLLQVAGSQENADAASAEDEADEDDSDVNGVRESRRRSRRVKPDAELSIPGDAADRARYEASFARFCEVFPDTFYVGVARPGAHDAREAEAATRVGC